MYCKRQNQVSTGISLGCRVTNIIRGTYQFMVVRARHTERISIASSFDFSVTDRERWHAKEGQTLLPYCLDPLRRRSLYVAGADLEAAAAAPFYYLHLRRTAKAVVSVPWEQGRLVAGGSASPILVFSPGRVGSTLLSAILFEAGIPNVSEPDFFTQMTRAFAAGPLNPLRAAMQGAALNLGRDLASAFGQGAPVVAKLRAECCRAPWLILETGRPKTIFMTRRFEAWARSTRRVFRAGPKRAVAKYLQSLRALDWLQRNTQCHLLLYDSLLADLGGECAALGAFLGCGIAADAAARALARDSQEGTPLELGARPEQADADEVVAETLKLWGSDKLVRIRASLPLFDA